jgi:hypothetical protein
VEHFWIWLAVVVFAFSAPDAVALQRPAATVHHEQACPYYEDRVSCARPDTGEIWLAPGAGRFEMWHELGHVFDHDVLTDPQRDWFTRVLRFDPGTPWDDGTGFGTRGPSEVFADAFATCATRKRPQRRGAWVVSTHEAAYGWNYTRDEYRRVCTAIAVLQTLAEPARG